MVSVRHLELRSTISRNVASSSTPKKSTYSDHSHHPGSPEQLPKSVHPLHHRQILWEEIKKPSLNTFGNRMHSFITVPRPNMPPHLELSNGKKASVTLIKPQLAKKKKEKNSTHGELWLQKQPQQLLTGKVHIIRQKMIISLLPALLTFPPTTPGFRRGLCGSWKLEHGRFSSWREERFSGLGRLDRVGE